MPIVFRCAGCGAVHTDNAKRDWGRTAQSDGYGPRPKCAAMVPNEYAPRTPQGDTPLQVCGGDLVAESVADIEVENARALGVLVTHTKR